MIIQDQYGTGLLFSENVMGLGTRKNEDPDKKSEDPDLFAVMTVPMLSTEPNIVLGLYTTKERAEEVLYSIRNAMMAGDPVYYMPLE